MPLPAGARPAGASPGAAQASRAARAGVRSGGLPQALGVGSVALLAASALLLLALCSWIVAVERRLSQRRDRWRPRPPPRPHTRSGARPSRVLLLAADEGADAEEEGYVQPRTFPPPAATQPHGASAPAAAPARAHSYLLVVGENPVGTITPAYEEVSLRPKATGSEEGYVPMQRRRVPTVLRVVGGRAQVGELALGLSAVGIACDEYLFMQPQSPPAPHDTDVAHSSAVTLPVRPLPPLPPQGPEYSTCGPPTRCIFNIPEEKS